MPDRPTDRPTAILLQLQPDVRPDEQSLVAPAAYANTVRISPDPNGFTLSFMAAPGDLIELESVRQQIEKNPPSEGDSLRIVQVRLPAVAKIWLPGEILPDVMKVMGQQYTQWLNRKAAAEKEGRDAAH